MVVEEGVLRVPNGTYLLNTSGRASPSLREEVSSRVGFDIDRDTLERIVRGLSVSYPKVVDASLTLGLEEIRISNRKPRKSTRPRRGLYIKASTAMEWLDENPEDLEEFMGMILDSGTTDVGVLLELPEVMKKRIAEQLNESFGQDYWDNISETTGGRAEEILQAGLRDGRSIRDMAADIEESLGDDDYARSRSYNIARTESGNALNGARREEMDGLANDVPELKMRATWLSVLGPTTREAHADLDGVPADDDGMWDLNGVIVPWPGHTSLPAKDRCNCQCTITMEMGMQDEEARSLIEEYYARQEQQGEE
jgi:hypothetical protein